MHSPVPRCRRSRPSAQPEGSKRMAAAGPSSTPPVAVDWAEVGHHGGEVSSVFQLLEQRDGGRIWRGLLAPGAGWLVLVSGGRFSPLSILAAFVAWGRPDLEAAPDVGGQIWCWLTRCLSPYSPCRWVPGSRSAPCRSKRSSTGSFRCLSCRRWWLTCGGGSLGAVARRQVSVSSAW
jgi:hypothetical protein